MAMQGQKTPVYNFTPVGTIHRSVLDTGDQSGPEAFPGKDRPPES